MIDKETLRKVVKLQREELLSLDLGVERDKTKEIDLNLPFAIILSGIRRSGKSTLLRQLMKKTSGFYYFNFEDSRATSFEIEDFEKLDQIFHEEYGNQETYFFDEIQNVQKWELFVRRLVDLKRHILITGSNASLLSKELGTRLTGRHLTYEIFPFSFNEFLNMSKKNVSLESFEDYLFNGGFPEYLKFEKVEILQELLRDVLERDINMRYKVRNQKALREMAAYLLSNIGKPFTYNALKKIFKFGSIHSAISFVSYFEDSYVLFAIPKFDYSFKKMIINPKKIYSIDNGFSIKNSTSFSSDKGRLLENLVFISIRKKNKDVFYFQENHECDFLVRDKARISEVIQVCYELNDDNKERELNGLVEAMKKFNLKQGLLLTYNQEDAFEIEGKKVVVKPVWKWLLN